MSSSAVPVLPAAGRSAPWAAVAVPLSTTLCRTEVVVSAASRLTARVVLFAGSLISSVPSLVIFEIIVYVCRSPWLAMVA